MLSLGFFHLSDIHEDQIPKLFGAAASLKIIRVDMSEWNRGDHQSRECTPFWRDDTWNKVYV